MRAAALAVALLLLPGLLYAQSTSASQSTSSSQPTTSSGTSQPASGGQSSSGGGSNQPPNGKSAQEGTPQPVPYSPDEFPLWMRQLRRAEIITIGAFPIALLVSSLGYQTIRYAQHGYSQSYTPALFGTSATPLTDQEKIGILLGAAGLSLSVALADFIVGKLTKQPASGTQP